MGGLESRTALVTGASRGIGAEIARRFAAEGARVVVSARTMHQGQSRFSGTLAETVEQIRAAGGEAVAVQADLSVPADREQLAAAAAAAFGPIDVLVNNAAVTFFAGTEELPAKRFRLMLEVQLHAAVHLARLVIPSMRSRGGGHILNISSKAALHPGPDSPAFGSTYYGMCKAALERFSTGLAAELRADNIAVNALAPTDLVVTPGVKWHRLDELLGPEHVEDPAVMAEAALVLCSADPAQLTGRIAWSQELLAETGRAEGVTGS